MTNYGFTKQGAKRIVDAVRTVEANDPLYAGPKTRKRRPGVGPEAFVLGRVTAVDPTDPTLVSVQEQYWDEAEGEMIDLPSGRLWDGEAGNPAKVRVIDGQARGVDDLVALGFRHGDDGTGVWFVVPDNKGLFHAKITASSSGSANHTLAELDANGDVLPNGRTPTDAQALNERKGVPVDTKVIAFDLGPTVAGGDPVYKFLIPDGLTDSPKDLIDTGIPADTTDWDIEVDSEAVEYLACRVKDDIANSGKFYFYNREIKADASGMLVFIDQEDRVELPGNGYYETRVNNVLVDQIANNGVLDFDDQQAPGTDEVVVQWTLTGGQDADAGVGGNDGLRTQIQGVVDLSAANAGSVNGYEVVDKLIEGQATGTATVDSDDYSGRLITWGYQVEGSETDASYDAGFAQSVDANTRVIGTNAAADIDLYTNSDHKLFIDVSDGFKLKHEFKTAPSAGSHWFRVFVLKGPQKAAADADIVVI